MNKEILGEYKLVLGLEVHMQPKVKHKMFCGCSAEIWKAEPNTHTCPVCLGLPGALPVVNYEAVEKTLLLGAALNCKLNTKSRFDRKHYFYPDLPKGYQISQYKEPLCGEGYLELDSGKIAEIERIHLEEDAAKSFHEGTKTLIDFNKGGMALMELVTKPIFTDVDDAVDFTKKLQQLLRHLGISEADMEKGQLRLEPNISLRTKEMEEKNELPKYKVEVKNINSFRFMEKVVLYEIKRQRELLESGEVPAQENRGYDETTGKTVSQRSKEDAHDYRYFPDPDIPPMEFEQTFLDEIKANLPELPMDTRKRLTMQYGVKMDHAKTLIDTYGYQMVEKFEALVQKSLDANKVIILLLNRKDYQNLDIEEFVKKIDEEKSVVLEGMEETLLAEIITKVLDSNLKAVEDYKKGKEASFQFLLGMIMKETKGKASPQMVKDMLASKLV